MISGKTESWAASEEQEEIGPLRRDGMTWASKVPIDY